MQGYGRAPAKQRDASDSVQGREARRSIEPVKPRDCDGAVSLRQGLERRVEIRLRPKLGRDVTEPDDLGADRQRRQELRALQRLGRVRQCREPAVDTAFPIARQPWDGTRREAAQIAQGQCQQPSRSECGRQRRQQAKCKRRGAAACDDRQRAVIELHGVVAHLVCGREQRHEIGRHGSKHRRLPWLGPSGRPRAPGKDQSPG